MAFASRAAVLVTALAVVVPPFAAVHALQIGDQVKISEVHYDPIETPETSFEFIEIANAGTTTVYLDGAVVTDEGNDGGTESTFQFPGTPLTGTSLPLAPGAIVLLVGDATGCPYAGVDFEFFAGTNDSDDPAVPNLVKTSGLAADLYLANSGDGVTLSVGGSSGNIIPCGEVVDGVSWETGGAPDVTATSPGTCADPAPHPGIDNSSRSLQRCPESLDSDSSASDFVDAPRTPGAANVCVFPGPVIESAGTAPCVPSAGQAVQLTCVVTDADGDVTSVQVFFRLAGAAAFDSLVLNPVVAGLYQVALPGAADQALVEYFVRALDSVAQSAVFPAGAPAELARYRVGVTAIATVQSSLLPDSCASSSFAGTPVHVAGVVTHQALEFSASYFYLQHGVGPYAGIRVAVPDGGYIPAIGDSLLVSGIVAESTCQTQILLDAGCVQLLATGQRVRARNLTSAADIALESNESMLVRLAGALEVLTAWDSIPGQPVAGAEFQFGDGLSAGWIGDDTFMPDGIGYWYAPVPRDALESITGIVSARWPSAADPVTRLRLEPRRDPDVDVLITSGTPAPEAVAAGYALEGAAPNPFNPSTTVGYAVPEACRVSIVVHDTRGRRVRTLLERAFAGAARGHVVWDGRDAAGRALPSGVYWVRLRSAGAANVEVSRKLVLAR